MDRLDEIDAALCRLDPTRMPLSEPNKAALRETLADAAPLTEAQRLRVVRLFGGTQTWRAIRQAAA